MRTRHSNGLLIVAICLISTAPLYAQRQQQNAVKLKADARNVVGTIANDKAKTQTYCQILDFARQLVRADQVKDTKKTKMLSEKIDQLQKQLGPEFVALMNGLAHLDRRSPDGREVALIIERLNQWCPEKQQSYKNRRRNVGRTSASRAGRLGVFWRVVFRRTLWDLILECGAGHGEGRGKTNAT